MDISSVGEPRAMSPAGVQTMARLRLRRVFVFSAWATSFALIAWAVATMLGAGGWTWLDVGIFICFVIASPLTVLGFWNAVIGLVLSLRGSAGAEAVSPFAGAGENATAPIFASTAILLTLRNEDPARAMQRFKRIKAELDRCGSGERFRYYVLSDTSDEAIARREEALVGDWMAEEDDRGAIHYRRRDDNSGFKAGNVRDFLERWGAEHDLMLPLDADSVMDAASILRLVRIMQANPKIGILQSLVVGMPSESPFARIFQFGMRHGMRAYTMGFAWWAGDCGPYWGHNALVRVAPFARHCALPVLPGKPPLGGHILSHDQIEAVLMRRAGYEVRVLPEEIGSWEENPPTLAEFTKRDLRWCQGNMQYWRLLGMKGLKPVSRFQLVHAIWMYFGAPAWMAMTVLATAMVFTGLPADFPVALGVSLFALMFFLSASPKIAGLIDVFVSRKRLKSYGGLGRFTLGAITEFLFSILLAPVVALRLTIFMIGLVFGRAVIWNGQMRDSYQLTWASAASGLWPQLVFGTALAIPIIVMTPQVLPWAAPVLTGLIVAIPFAVVTSMPALGRILQTFGICAIPEEFDRPETLAALLPVETPGDVVIDVLPEPVPVAAAE